VYNVTSNLQQCISMNGISIWSDVLATNHNNQGLSTEEITHKKVHLNLHDTLTMNFTEQY